MQDMKNLNEMGFITNEWMDQLEHDAVQAERNNTIEAFLAEKSGAHQDNNRHRHNKDTKPVMNRGKIKRIRKLEKKARKLQRA